MLDNSEMKTYKRHRFRLKLLVSQFGYTFDSTSVIATLKIY